MSHNWDCGVFGYGEKMNLDPGFVSATKRKLGAACPLRNDLRYISVREERRGLWRFVGKYYLCGRQVARVDLFTRRGGESVDCTIQTREPFGDPPAPKLRSRWDG